ncbi:DUF982 domain-containing protein [Rhizobium sp. ARZ01]|uniref:DUF982 domain-containing protein n=1 Tax=Rhizobium sp. ARZ01 TaxID=2769313 RepID=UPI00177D6396|nr:DUF982 domain-containing protein [Rhizobium sp. ARZ01]MBD9371793.1 DUF982 domain-containing protein [Rhizobium sp. ARZ01]
MLVPDLPWSVPLIVRLQNGMQHIFAGPFEALDFLENEWPLRRSQKRERAVRLCRAALNRRTPLAVARESFVSACLEAGLPVAAAHPHATKTSGGQRSRP